MDHKKILKGLVLIVMAAALAIIVLAADAHVKKGLATSESKLMLGAYILMGLYAAFRTGQLPWDTRLDNDVPITGRSRVLAYSQHRSKQLSCAGAEHRMRMRT